MASLSPFADVQEEKLNSLTIQKAVPEKNEIARNYGINNFKGKKKMNLKYQFDSFTR